MPGRGLFVVLEGIDGSGKSEQARRLAGWLRERGKTVVETREPTDGEWGRRYRAWACGEHEAEPEEVLRYFVEDRRQHVARVIRPALEAGTIVVCDRYVDSTLAYQAAQGIPLESLRARMQDAGFPVPDLVLWLKLPVEQALARLQGPGERFERAAFLARVAAVYEALGLEVIDASGPPGKVTARIRERLEPLLVPDD